MSGNFAINNKTTNLIPIINPNIKENTDTGIKLALKYRITNCTEIDSSKLVKNAYQEWYGNDIPKSADTIFNIHMPFRDFCISKLKKLSKDCCPFDKLENGKCVIKNDLNKLIYNKLELIFNENKDLEVLFNETFNLMYSFSNFMPVPYGFNGTNNYNGKGTYRLNKDYPYLYLENLKDKNIEIKNKKENLAYLNNNMERFKIKAMYELEPPYHIDQYYEDEKKESLKKWLKNVKFLIEHRFINSNSSSN